MNNKYSRALFLTAFTAASTFQAADVKAELLRPGQSITTNQRFYGDHNLHFATLKEDGVLLVVRNDGRIAWATHTKDSGAVTVNMQADGNLVMYNAQGQAVWSTGTWGPDRAFGINAAGSLLVMRPTKKNKTRYWSATNTIELAAAGGVMEWRTPPSGFPPPRYP